MGRAVPEEKSRGRRTCRPPRAAMIRAGRIAARPGVCQLSTISVAPCITLPTCLLVLAVVLIAALRRATRTAGCGLEHVWGLIALLNAARHVIFRQTVLRSEAAEALEEAAGIAQVVPNIAETHPHML